MGIQKQRFSRHYGKISVVSSGSLHARKPTPTQTRTRTHILKNASPRHVKKNSQNTTKTVKNSFKILLVIGLHSWFAIVQLEVSCCFLNGKGGEDFSGTFIGNRNFNNKMF